ncbi:MAG: excinuclease ABC subunit UvrC [Rhodothermales bacterium]
MKPTENTLLAEKLANLPARPGVYQHKDAGGQVLYVGKAKSLRSRVRSYFQESRPRDGRLDIMVRKIADIEIIVTDTEAEALILENNLIKKLKPRYNVNLRDDKTYPFICIKNEPFPRVFPTRRVHRDGSRYFGPYTDVKNMHLMLSTIRSLFKIRTCSLNLAPEPIAAGKYQVCLQYHIKKCLGPCVGEQTPASYNTTIQQIEKLLNGHTRELIRLLEDEMQRLAGLMKFEEAAALRDQVVALKKYSEKQRMVSQDFVDRDVFALAIDREINTACGVLFKVREGTVVGRQHKYLRQIEDRTDEELMQSLLEHYYTESTFFPEEVLVSVMPSEPEPLEELLRERRGKKVTIKAPERGDKAGLNRMVESNAQLLLDEYKLQKAKQEEGRIPHAVKTLQTDLHMSGLPRHIECFDISHLGGTGTVASCVVFEDGRPKKSAYRTFKIRSVEGKPDDFQSMYEVITRRYAKLVEENGPWPDLVVIDGGKGQLSSAAQALKEVDAYGKFTVVGLAKRLEEVFFPGDQESVMIPRTSASLQLLQRIRNEAHRFAVTFQRKQRATATLTTVLHDIPGVGEKTARKLLKTFGSVKRTREASFDELAGVVGKKTAEKVFGFLHAESQREQT